MEKGFHLDFYFQKSHTPDRRNIERIISYFLN